MNKPLKVAVGISGSQWHKRFASALEEKINDGLLCYEFVDLARHDWLETVRPFDAVIWKPSAMGISGSSHFKEKIYVLDCLLKKLVVPNYSTIWHFESKIAQSYLFAIHNVPTPRTTATFSHQDAEEQLRAAAMPLVFKRSSGAASKYVELVRSAGRGLRYCARAFCGQLYGETSERFGSRRKAVLRSLCKPWFWSFIRHYLADREPSGCLYWQEYLPGNDADLRITVIGDRYAYGFWRLNREGDFRASGGGRIDLQRAIPEECLRYCLEVNRRLEFDSMAYDILFKEGNFVISEISYGYLDSVPYKAAGHYELQADGRLDFIPGHTWPQTLWIDWLLERAARRGILPESSR